MRVRPGEWPGNPLSETAECRGSGTQAMATLSTTALQNQTPTLGGHTGTETVCALTLQIARLECSFHSDASLAGCV